MSQPKLHTDALEIRPTLVITMTGHPNDIFHYMKVLREVAWQEGHDTARVFDKFMIFPRKT